MRSGRTICIAVGVAFSLAVANSALAQDKPKDGASGKPESVRTETTSYQNWNVICRSMLGSKEKPDCVAELRVADGQTKALVIVWQIRRGKAKKLTTRIQTPTGVKVKPGVALKLGDEVVATFDYDFCMPQNCEAVGPLDEALVAKIDAASAPFRIVIQGQLGQMVTFETTTKGIKQAVSALVGED